MSWHSKSQLFETKVYRMPLLLNKNLLDFRHKSKNVQFI